MFETLAWELEAAVNVGLGSLFGGGSDNKQIEKKPGGFFSDTIHELYEDFESQKWIHPIMAIGESEYDAGVYSNIIYKALKAELIIDKNLAKSIAEKIGADAKQVEIACDIYRQLMFFYSKGITDSKSLKRITSISKVLVVDNGESIKDPNEVAEEYGFSLDEVNAVVSMLNEFASKYQSSKPFTMADDSVHGQQQPKQQSSSRKNNNKNNPTTGTNQ